MDLLSEFIGVPERQILHEVHIQKLINLALPETFTYCMSYRDGELGIYVHPSHFARKRSKTCSLERSCIDLCKEIQITLLVIATYVLSSQFNESLNPTLLADWEDTDFVLSNR